jgi:hypothetical protein
LFFQILEQDLFGWNGTFRGREQLAHLNEASH